MKKYLDYTIDGTLVGLFLMLIIGVPFLLTRPTNEKTIPLRLSPIVRLVDEGRTFCSGVVIRHDLILTAMHCVSQTGFMSQPYLNEAKIEIRGVDNKPLGVYGQAVAGRLQLDQALISGDFRKFQSQRITMTVRDILSYQRKGEHFVACGYPLGGELFCQNVFFDSNREFMWAVHGVILPGMSGGPVTAEDGSVVATNDAVDGSLSIVAPVWNLNVDLPKEKK